jgi:drug/metabolite transporter (DMT)-like permease
MNEKFKANIKLHTAVLLFGITAILGALISIPALGVVWWRVLFTALSLLAFASFKRMRRELSKKQVLRFMLVGVLIAIHWLTFFGAIKLSNASITLVCLATTTFFTAFTEPILTKKPFYGSQILIGILIIPGMYLVVNGVSSEYMNGIWVGLISALMAAIFGTLNKKWVEKGHAMDITFIEITTAWLFLTLILPFVLIKTGWQPYLPSGLDFVYLFILAFLCTTFAFYLTLKALRHLSAFQTALTINLEPVYGILLAAWLLKENKDLNTNFYIGSIIILLAVFLYPLLKKYTKQ